MTTKIDNSKVDWPELGPVSQAEREVWTPPKRAGILEHTRNTFILPAKTSRITGPWSDEYTPYVRRPLELLERPPVRVWVSACRQSGKSTTGSVLANYIFSIAPGPTGIVLPQEGIAKDRIRTKMRQLFESNPHLFEKIGNDVRNLNIGDPTDLGDLILYLCWASSIATLSDRTIQNMIYDEVALFELTTDGENPVELGRDRQFTYKTIARELGLSSAGDVGDIHDEQMRTGSDEWWHVPCMKKGCGRWHKLRTYVDPNDEKYIVLDRPAAGMLYSPKEYETNPKRSRYVCPHCGTAWTDADRWRSNQEGIYISEHREERPDGTLSPPAQTMDANGAVTGAAPTGPQYSFTWHSMMLYPLYGSVSDAAATYAGAEKKKKAGDLSLYKKWTRSYQARPWKETAIEVADKDLTKRILDNLPARRVPAGAQILAAAADYHEDEQRQVRIDFEVRAFGVDLINWVILAGSVTSWSDLEDELFAPFAWADEAAADEELYVNTLFVDSGDETDEVYCWAGQYIGWAWPIKGAEYSADPLRYTDMKDIHEDREKKGKRRMRAAAIRGQHLVTVSQNFFSGLVTRWVTNEESRSGQTFFYNAIHEDTNGRYFSEFKNMKKEKTRYRGADRWKWIADGPVHFHDVARYAAAAGYHNRVQYQRTALKPEDLPEAIRKKMAARKTLPKGNVRVKRQLRTKY